jgi:hypothetical protein
MFIFIVAIIFVIAFVLALKSLRTLDEKPGIKAIKRSLDKDRVIYHSRSSS